MMKRNLRVYLLTLCSLLLLLNAGRASFVYISQVEGRYFKVKDNRSHDYEVAASWQWWLQVHRAIKANPHLRKKFAAKPLDFTKDSINQYKSGATRISSLGLTQRQVEKQPTYVYTLHIASYRKQDSLQEFLKRYWLGKRMNRRRVYKSNPKQLSFSTTPGDVMARNDALYSSPIFLQGTKWTRVCYGVYENVADADSDRRILKHSIGLNIRIIRERPTTSFVDRFFYKPFIDGQHAAWQGWETANY